MSIWNGGRTFVTIRDNTTYEELGVAYDLINTSIYEEINNKYTLNFNILPFYNVYRIRHPNFLEINGDYFRIRRVEKKRNDTIMMAISCEHISYELNNQYELDAENEEIELPDYPYEGTPTEILTEILQGSRFTIGTVQFTQSVSITLKPMGARSRIIELAKHIGAEVKWDKFSVSLVARRGAVRNLSFEVGKNLLSMTEVYETHANGAFNRFYDVDVIDLSLIENEGVPEELYDIRLGDTVTLIDESFNININQRVVSYEIDPFRKELPKIQLEHVMKNITNTVTEITNTVKELASGGGGGEPVALPIYQEEITRTPESNAFGYATAATNFATHAEGEMTQATGYASHAEGSNTKAIGLISHAEGSGTQAKGHASHAEGEITQATGRASHAEGSYTVASDEASHAEGEATQATGRASHAEGMNTQATGYASHAEGYYSVASGWYSHASGFRTIADQANATAVGKYNRLLTEGDIFVIGVGTSGTARSNGFRVTTSGATYGQSAFNSAGADYAEYFEWEDGNPENQDRKGYFVTLEGDKIRIATSADEYVLGVVSINPSVVGDSYQDQWANMYLTNEWGEIQKEMVTIPAELDDEGNAMIPERNEIRPVLNPEYNSESEYTPREQRPEWSPIGMMGKLLVRDDGTSKVNGYCKPNDQGIATSSTVGYRVMERVNENIIRVLVK